MPAFTIIQSIVVFIVENYPQAPYVYPTRTRLRALFMRKIFRADDICQSLHGTFSVDLWREKERLCRYF